MEDETVVRIAELIRQGKLGQDLARSQVQALNASMSGAVVEAHGREGVVALIALETAPIALGSQGSQVQVCDACHSAQARTTPAVHNSCGRFISAIDFVGDIDRLIRLMRQFLGNEPDVDLDRRVTHHEGLGPEHLFQATSATPSCREPAARCRASRAISRVGHRRQDLLAAHDVVRQEKLPTAERGAEALLGEVGGVAV